MTREQGLEVIKQLFSNEVEYVNQGARFYYISPGGESSTNTTHESRHSLLGCS